MDDDQTQPSESLAVGTEISQYRIIDKIGSGGMGEVYRAHDNDLDRIVALKFLAFNLSDDIDCRVRFKREAQAAAGLNHANVVTIHEVSEYQRRPYFAMEYIEGKSLEDYMSGEQVDLERFLDLSVQICEGLVSAHECGVVHRDIKPSNILIDANGRPRIADFGLAVVKGRDDATGETSSGGTLAYMSPEQAQGEDAGVVSDLFSLGAVFYEMLAGHRPFAGDYEAALIYSITNEDPRPIGQFRTDIPPELVSLVMKLLEKDPKNRYQSARELFEALQSLSSPQEQVVPSRSKDILRIGIPVLLLIVLVVVLQIVYNPLGPPVAERKMLAVLPFENLGQPEDEYFADGMTDAITLNLAKHGGLRVISRTSTMLYKETDKTPSQIGDELGVSYLLTGTILWDKSGGASKVRINAALVKAEDGSHLWADSYERVLDRIFDLQSEIAPNVTRALNLAVAKTTGAETLPPPTDNLVAYDYFLRGNEYFNRSWDREDIQIATGLYQRAIDLDPEFALAHAMLARGHASMYWEYFDRTEERRQMAVDAANLALKIQPGLVEGHLALGYCYYHCVRDYQRALGEFELALKKQPNNAELHNAIAAVQRRQGDLAGSASGFTTALELDPRSHLKAFDVGLTYGMMRQYGRSEEYLAKTNLLAPDWPLPYIYRSWLAIIGHGNTERASSLLKDANGKADLTRSKYYWWLSRVIEPDIRKILSDIHPGIDTAAFHIQCAQLNRLLGNTDSMHLYADSARVVLEERIDKRPDDAGYHSSLGLAYAHLGMKAEAITSGEKAVELLPASKEAFDAPFLLLNLAEILVIFEEYDAAIEQLQYLLSIPGFISGSYLRLDPLWAPLRDHPGFKKLLAESS